MTTRPDISVVVPLFNGAATIGETLVSVCRQTARETLELIVVDDRSTDDGLAIAREAVAGRGLETSFVEHRSNQGASAARNTGWRLARGAWLQFLDADDLLEPDKCARQLDVARHLDHQTTVVYSAWGRLVPTGEGWTPSPDVVSPSVGADALLDVLRADNFLATGSYLVRRDAVERIGGYDEAFRIVQDVALLVSLALDGGRFLHAPSRAPVSWYRERPGSLSRSNQARFIDECLMNADRAEAYWTQAANGLTDDRRRVLAAVHFMAARYYAQHDAARFEAAVARLQSLMPSFVPESPPGLRRLSRLVGYPAAERTATHFRRARRWMGR